MTWFLERPDRALRPAPPNTERDAYEQRQALTARQEAAQASDPAQARAWLERAARFAPGDGNIACALAAARLAAGDIKGALDMFSRLAARFEVREILLGQAVAATLAAQPGVAIAALQLLLSRFALTQAGAAAAARAGIAWCGVTSAGVVRYAGADRVHVALDGRRVVLTPDGVLPPRWRHATTLTVRADGGHLRGSPIDLAAIRRVEGFVTAERGWITGWAWQPGDPDADPVLTIEHGADRVTLTARDSNVDVSGATPLVRARGFRVRRPGGETAHVKGADGRALWGSPLCPPQTVPSAARARRTKSVAVVIPVYRGKDVTLSCVRSVIATVRAADRIVVVNDASPEPALVAALRRLAATGAISLIDANPAAPLQNLGFPGAANAGLRFAAGRDAVLLNSDTLVFPGWLSRLRAAAHALPDIGTATPLSNDASIVSYPDPNAPTAAPMPSAAEGAALDALAARTNAGILVDVPTGHGFCLFIRADCLHATGLLREDVFAQGYGEENDFCERARAGGWRHVAVPSVYVAHQGGASFGAARGHLLARNAALLDRLHPTYHRRVAAFIAADGLLPSRRRIDMARWRDAAPGARGAVLLVTHGSVGGTTRVVAERAAAIRAKGLRPVVIGADAGLTTVDAAAFPNLRFNLPRELGLLADLLAAAHPRSAELHNLLGHGRAVIDLMTRFGLPYDIWVHDWGWICPRVALVTPEGTYCGEPPAAACDACVRRGEAPDIPISATDLRAHSAALLGGARGVIAPSQDAALRLRRHFPMIKVATQPWEVDQPRGSPRLAPPALGGLIVAVVGAISQQKGHTLLIECARDAAARRLPLRFAVIGFTADDEPLLATGHATVTGRFAPGEAAALIAGSGARLGFLPSIWPETWCYALSDLWDAGLPAVVLDIGTPAERVRTTGAGWVLPLGLPAPGINDALLRLQGLAGRSVAQPAVPADRAAPPFQERDELP